ncbi:hypothetical protein OKJ48_17935 [Streptomyces kunmingensis]|uniref:Uncharacterized protein n=1 Tax=Streptomyces kunmingensis TaxID=68225 RepID=A0ABU6CCM4_9ACTN|nr:hypothetical protein [Streptomyces kunmingensis]MEB3962115.1 hypothetical protein [Streptomyces kunmingensis]
MNLEQRLADEARDNRDRRFTALALAFFAAMAAFGTVTHTMEGTLPPPMVGADLMLFYGAYLAVQGWRQKETRLSCAAMLVVPGLAFAAYLVK